MCTSPREAATTSSERSSSKRMFLAQGL
jgi:hypothetical protein